MPSRQAPAIPPHLQEWCQHNPPVRPWQPAPAVTPQTAASELDRFRVAMREFSPRRTGLPIHARCQCPRCERTVPSTFDRRGEQVVLVTRCPDCGEYTEVHADAVFAAADEHRPASARQTFGGRPIQPICHDLPRTVETLCPECSAILLGRYYARDGAVWIEKTCPRHGHFRDKVNSDVRLFLKSACWSFDEGPGLTHPLVRGARDCPSDCGLCDQHQSSSVLGQIDLTNRCNLTCPVCFANANANGHVYQPGFEEVVAMLHRLRDLRPIRCTSVQFTGGEPTIHPQFHEIVAQAAAMDFSNIQIATNGITHAHADFARRSAEAGLHTLYLQFDGFDDAVYGRLRGEAMLEKKLQCIENCRRFGMKVCLVPTIIKGENDDQVGPILEFAADHADVISAISYQPVCFTGRISRHDLAAKRYTLGDLAADVAAACGAEVERDFYPLSIVAPLSDLLSVLCRASKIKPTCHPDCAFGTYLLIAPRQYEGQPVRERMFPIPQVFDVPGMFTEMDALARQLAAKRCITAWDKLRIVRMFLRHFRRENAPPGFSVWTWIRTLRGMVDKGLGRGRAGQANYRTLMAAGMHFQDRYNYDVQRVRRCVILYSTPIGVIPFCAYNSGPTYRDLVTQRCAEPAEAWARANPRHPLRPSSNPNAFLPWMDRFGQPVADDQSWRTLRRDDSPLAETLDAKQ